MNFTIIGILFLSFFVISIIIKISLDIINLIHRNKHRDFIPEELKEFIDKEKLNKIHNYSTDKLKINLFSYFFEKVLILIIIFSGVIPTYYNLITNNIKNIYINGLIFFLSLFLLQFILSIPFSLYFNFKIEKKYGFNKMTITLWITDTIKELIISFILYAIILLPLIFFIYNLKDLWFLFVWLLLFLFSLFMQILYPTVIAPMFNKFEPLKNEGLKDKIESLITKCGFKSKGIFEMDESKRTTHSNAYFIGLGKTKRIVLFDTLIQKHTDDEILAIIAHELGHFKHKHILKNLIFSSLFSIIVLFLTKILIQLPLLYQTFKFNEIIPLIGLVYVWLIFEPITFLGTPVRAFFSRKAEYQADDFSKKELRTPLPLINALKKMTIDNLSNIYPHPLYEWFYYSHPSILKRIDHLKK